MNALRLTSLLSLVGLLAPIASHAQSSAPKIYVIDIAAIYDKHWLTQIQNEKLSADEAKANQDLGQMVNEGNAMLEQFRALDEQSKSPTLTADAKAKLQADAQKKLEEIQQKQVLVNSFRSNMTETLQQRIKQFRDLMLEQIVAAATKVAQAKGATLLLDKSGPSMIGIPPVIFADASYDLTEEVMAEINKERPPAAVTPPAGPAAAPAAGAPAQPPPASITLPSATKK